MGLLFSNATLLLMCCNVSSAASPSSPSCTSLTITPTVTASANVFPSSLDLLALTALPTPTATTTVSGVYDIAGVYCQPAFKNENSTTLQFLNHGLTQTHHYWSGQDFGGAPFHGSNYSWTTYANALGYPTLAIDRLGNGNSSHPDPLLEVQLFVQVQVAHSIVSQVKQGVLGAPYSDNVYIGHSFGSIVGVNYVAAYPQDLSKVILTGWTRDIIQSSIGSLAQDQYQPASLVSPSQYANLPPAYVMSTNKNGASQLVFYDYGTSQAGLYFDQSLANVDFANRGTCTLGELFTTPYTSTPATKFSGHVLVSTGKGDGYFCGVGVGNGDCGSGDDSIVAQASSAFPNAASYEYFIPEHTGHETILHYTQEQSFENAHAWLAQH